MKGPQTYIVLAKMKKTGSQIVVTRCTLGRQKCGHAHLIYGNMASDSEPKANEGETVTNLFLNTYDPGTSYGGLP